MTITKELVNSWIHGLQLVFYTRIAPSTCMVDQDIILQTTGRSND